MTILNIVDALHTGDGRKVTAASIGRIWQLVQDLDSRHFAILSAYRNGLSGAENKSRQKKLEASLRQNGFGFVKLIGHWRECQDDSIDYQDCPEDLLVDVTEPSLFVYGINLADAQRIIRPFNQDAIVYGGPEVGNRTALVFRNGLYEPLGAFSPKAIGQAFSTLARRKNRGFHFLSSATSSAMEAQSASVYERSKYGKRLYNAVTGGRLRK